MTLKARPPYIVEEMLCKICQTRKAKRYCPGVDGQICAICCGTEREVTVSCPFDCPYLQDARQHERLPQLSPDDVPNKDVRVTDRFLAEHEPLLIAAGRAVLEGALRVHGAVDFDVRDALDNLARTYRTLQSGVYYESRPENPMAARVYEVVQQRMREFREAETQERGLSSTRDADVLGILVFLQRIEFNQNNGRKKGRAFIDFLRQRFSEGLAMEPTTGGSGLIIG